jgi:hypothetical protein
VYSGAATPSKAYQLPSAQEGFTNCNCSIGAGSVDTSGIFRPNGGQSLRRQANAGIPEPLNLRRSPDRL